MKKLILLMTLIASPLFAHAETTYTYTCAGYTDQTLTFVFNGTNQATLKYYGTDIEVEYKSQNTPAGAVIQLVVNPKAPQPMGILESAFTSGPNGSLTSEGLYHLTGTLQGSQMNCYLQFKPTPPSRCPRCQ